jgi:uncharacterized protein (DUF1697 family)
MARYVALFRGINVGKAKRIAMADLRALLEGLGYGDVKTLLNSGNAVFDAPDGAPARHAARIRAAVLEDLGVDSLVIVKSAAEIAAVVAGNKLAKIATDPSRLLVVLTTEAKALTALDALARSEWRSEKVHVGRYAAYAWCPKGFLESKAAPALLKGLGETGTTRNWATIEKLHSLMSE